MVFLVFQLLQEFIPALATLYRTSLLQVIPGNSIKVREMICIQGDAVHEQKDAVLSKQIGHKAKDSLFFVMQSLHAHHNLILPERQNKRLCLRKITRHQHILLFLSYYAHRLSSHLLHASIQHNVVIVRALPCELLWSPSSGYDTFQKGTAFIASAAVFCYTPLENGIRQLRVK